MLKNWLTRLSVFAADALNYFIVKVPVISSAFSTLLCLLSGCAATAVTVADKPTPPALVILPPGSSNIHVEAHPVKQK